MHFFTELEARAVNRALLVGSKTLSVHTTCLVRDTRSPDQSNVEQFHFHGKTTANHSLTDHYVSICNLARNKMKALLWLNTSCLNFEGRTANGFLLLKKYTRGFKRV